MHRERSLQPRRDGCSTSTGRPFRASSAASSQEPIRKSQLVRPKANLQSVLPRLIDFLEKTEYPNPLSVRLLQSPSAKEVYNIFEHMVRQVDPTFRLQQSGTKNAERCIETLRALGYTVNISKQHFTTPGAPHTWQAVQNTLDWLRQSCEDLYEFITDGSLFAYDDRQESDQEPLGKVFHEIVVANSRLASHSLKMSNEEQEMYRRRISTALGGVDPDIFREAIIQNQQLDRDLEASANLDKQKMKFTSELAEGETLLKELQQAQSQTNHLSDQAQLDIDRLKKEHSDLAKQRDELKHSLTRLREQLKIHEDKFGKLERERQEFLEREKVLVDIKNKVLNNCKDLELENNRIEREIMPILSDYNLFVTQRLSSNLASAADRCNMKIRTQKNFDIVTDAPVLVESLEAFLRYLRSNESRLNQNISQLNQDNQRRGTSINEKQAQLESTQSQLQELDAEFQQLTRLIAEQATNRQTWETESLQRRQQRTSHLAQLKSELADAERKLVEEKENLQRATDQRLGASASMKHFTELLSNQLDRLELVTQMKKNTVEALNLQEEAFELECNARLDRLEQRIALALQSSDDDDDK